MIFSKLAGLTKSPSLYVLKISKRTKFHRFQPLIMPHEMNRVQQLQKERQRFKAQSIKYNPSFAYLQVVGPGKHGEPRSVLLCTDHWNYLFNCGEGTQRLAAEHHSKLGKIENIFITRPTWNNMGGLPGTVLTIQESAVSSLLLHGPKDTIGIIEATENFMILTDLKVISADTTKTFSDQTMTVNYILLQKPCKITSDNDNLPDVVDENINFYSYQLKSNNRRRLSSTQVANRTKMLKQRRETDDLMIFICKLHRHAGNLDINACVKLGVLKGPAIGKLKAGEDITLPNGKIVKSEDVTGKSEPGPVFIVLECPDEEWMDLIIQNSTFAKYQKDTATEEENVAECIVHFTPEHILNNPKYKEWMRKFGTKTVHMMINEKNDGISSESMHKMQHQLHLIHPEIFPILDKKTKQNLFNQNSNNMNSFKNDVNNLNQSLLMSAEDQLKENLDPIFYNEGLLVRRCKTMDTFSLRPKKSLDTSKNIRICPNEYIKDIMEIDRFLDALADLQTEINFKTTALGNIRKYPRFLMLGTGSSVPNKIRNTSGILFQMDEDKSILLDCGEATFNQIIRFFGEEEAERVLKSIKAVYISHLHADHHLGLIGFLKQRKYYTDEPLLLLAPQQITPYLYYYHRRIDSIANDFKLISNRDLLLNQRILTSSMSKQLNDALGIKEINTTFVTHCPYSYAVAFTLNDDRKICYSGDTMPCNNLLKLAQDSFLLIHEATMEDGLEREAMMKRHSTISQAVNTGVKANVNFTLLTHFSQRYSKIPLLRDSEESGIDYSRVGIAYDFMLVSLDQLTLLPLFYKSLELMFSEFKATLDERAMRRNWIKERLVQSVEHSEV